MRRSESLRTGTAVTIDNELGATLTLTRWDTDNLTIEMRGDKDGNFWRFDAEFGIYGFLDQLAEMFAPVLVVADDRGTTETQ